MHVIRVAIALLIVCVSAAAAPQQEELLHAASSDEHVWYLQESLDHSTIEIRHHSRTNDGPWQTSLAKLTRMPEMLAARDNGLWMVFPPIAGDRSDKRDVALLRADFNAVVGGYERSPRDLLGAEPPLPAQGDLKGFVSSGRTLFALIAPVEGRRLSGSGEPLPDLPRLLRLEPDGWNEVPLPTGAHPTPDYRLAVSGDNADQVHLLIANRFQPRRTDLFTLKDDDSWSRTELNIATVIDLPRVHGQLSAVLREGEDAIRLTYLFDEQVVEIATLTRPNRPWKILGVSDGLLLLSRTPTGQIELQNIDPVRGSLGEPKTLAPQPIGAELLWQTALLATAFAMAVLFIVVGRPSARKPVSLPKDLAIASPVARLMALLIDMIPGGIIACLLFRVAPTELTRLPMMVGTFADSMPYLFMIVITAVHTSATELIRGTTMGKSTMGIRVAALSGAAPSRSSVGLRNILKLVILAIPPLAVFGLLTPHFQGLHDLVARTVIVTQREQPQE